MPNLNTLSPNSPIAQPLRSEAPKASAPAAQPAAAPSQSGESLTVSQAGQRGQTASTVSFGDRLGTASKFALPSMLGGVVIGVIHGAKTGGKGGGYGAAFGAVIGGGLGALKGGAIGLAAGGGAGLIYSYAQGNKSEPAPAAPARRGGTAVTDAKGIETDKPVAKNGDLFGDISKGAVAGTITGVVAGAITGGISRAIVLFLVVASRQGTSINISIKREYLSSLPELTSINRSVRTEVSNRMANKTTIRRHFVSYKGLTV